MANLNVRIRPIVASRISRTIRASIVRGSVVAHFERDCVEPPPGSRPRFESVSDSHMKDLTLPASPSPFKSAADLVNKHLVEAHRVWKELADRRFAPTRKEIAPARFKFTLSTMFLVDVVEGGVDFRLSLAGDTVIRFLGSEFKTGKLLTHVSPSPFRDRSFRLFLRCVETKAPVGLGPVRTLHAEHSYFDNEAVILPLSDDGQMVTGILGVIHLSAAVSGDPPKTTQR